MLKLFFFIIVVSLFWACDNSSKEPHIKYIKLKKNINKENNKKKHNFKIISFDKDLKNIYRNKKEKKRKKELKFNKLFKNIKNKVITIQFYVNFENFSSIPDIYKNKMNENNTFYILGVHIGDNYILTELNVLKEADVIYIKTKKGINYLNLIGYDENYNIALLKSPEKINKEKIDIQKIKNKKFSPGELVFSLFSISSDNLSFRKHFINFLHYSEFYEIVDAIYSQSISYIENSGGIIFNSEGNFLGIISLYDSYYENSGFIVTYQIIKKILPKLKKGYEIKNNAWLGLYLKKRKPYEIIVKKVINKSPAQISGIKTGDRIIKINKTKIKSRNDIKRIMSFANSGNILKLEIIRNHKNMNFQVKLIDKPLKYLYRSKKNKTEHKNVSIGIKLTEKNNSIMISEVEEGSLAFIYGVKVGDKILEIAGKKLTSIKEYQTYVNNLGKHKNIKIKLLRGKEVKLIAFKKS